MANPLVAAQAAGVAVLDHASWADDGDAYTVAGVSRPTPAGAPVVSGLSPATLAVSAEPQEVLVQGSAFTRDCRVSFGGASPPTSFHSDTELGVWIDPANWSPGTVLVFVAVSDRGPSDTAAAQTFTWT